MNWDGIFNCRGLSRFLELYFGKLLFYGGLFCFFSCISGSLEAS